MCNLKNKISPYFTPPNQNCINSMVPDEVLCLSKSTIEFLFTISIVLQLETENLLFFKFVYEKFIQLPNSTEFDGFYEILLFLLRPTFLLSKEEIFI